MVIDRDSIYIIVSTRNSSGMSEFSYNPWR